MSDNIRVLEDSLLQLFCATTEPTVKNLDRTAPDFIAEANRYKRELRNARKEANIALDSSLIKEQNGEPFFINYFGEKILSYCAPSLLGISTLKTLLESGKQLPLEVELTLGGPFDHALIGIWAQRHLKWHAAAQVHWFNNSTVNLEKMKDLIVHDHQLAEFLEFDSLPSLDNRESRFRRIEEEIRKVIKKKVGRPRNDRNDHWQAGPSPIVYCENSKKTNPKALYLTIKAITKILSIRGCTQSEIQAHPGIRMYKTLALNLEIFIDIWIAE